MIYIAGRRYSGSTFLDVMLGSAPGVESVGELVTGLSRGRGEVCGNGIAAGESAFWVAVAQRYAALSEGRDLWEDGAWLYEESDARKFVRRLFAGRFLNRPGSVESKYADRQIALVTAIGDVADASCVLDSNKEYSRALMILKIQAEAKVIHLHRSLLTSLGSHYYRHKQRGAPFKFLKRQFNPEKSYPFVLIMMAAAWSVGMALGLLIKAMFPDRVINVRYEKLMADPTVELARLGAFLEIDTAEIRAMVDGRIPFAVGHNLAGNELRHDGSFVFIPNTKGRRQLPFHLRLVALPFAAPGYFLRALFAR
ncbi:hypothetical protein GCM10009645_49640 [Mycolicibacterium poriferae]